MPAIRRNLCPNRRRKRYSCDRERSAVAAKSHYPRIVSLHHPGEDALRIVGKPERIDIVVSFDRDLSGLISQNLNKSDLVRILRGICDSYLRAIWGEVPEIQILRLCCHLRQSFALALEGVELCEYKIPGHH